MNSHYIIGPAGSAGARAAKVQGLFSAAAILLAGTGLAGPLMDSITRFTPVPEPVAFVAPGAGIRHDGKLDDPVWQSAPKQVFTRSWPDGSEVASAGYFQLAADSQTLYVAVSVPEPKPQFARVEAGKDQWAGDLVEFFVDMGDPQRRYQLCASPLGLRYDERAGDQKWNGNWTGKGQVTDKGWTLELSVPLSDLGLQTAARGQTWRGNLCLITAGRYVAWAGNWGDPGKFATFFVGDESDYRAACQSRLDVSCAFSYCNQHDAGAPLRVISQFDDAALDAMQLRVALKPEKGSARADTLPVARGRGRGIAFDLSLDGLARGTHAATVELLADGKPAATGTVTFARKDDRPMLPPSDRKGPVALRQTKPSPASAPGWYFVTGVPIPRGALTGASNARLVDGQGREIPAQTEPLAWWSPRKEHVKWLRVAFTAPAVQNQQPEYTLSFGPGITAASHPKPVRVTTNDAGFAIDTGEIAFTIPKSGGGFLSQVRRSGREVYASAPEDGPYVVDQDGASFRAALDPSPDVVVEEAGPVRAVVRVESWHAREGRGASQAGDRLNKSILRYYAYAGLPVIELHWTFIVTADTEKVKFRDIGLQMTGRGTCAIGLEDGKTAAMEQGFLLQKKPDLYVVRRVDKQGNTETARGKNAPGWIAGGSFALAMRDFRQMFPKELEIIPSPDSPKSQAGHSASRIIVHAWPGHGEYNDDWFIEPTTPPDPKLDARQIKGPNGVALYPRYFQNAETWHHGPLLDFSCPDWWHNPGVAGTIYDKDRADTNAPPEDFKMWLDGFTGCGNRALESWVLYSRATMPAPVKFHAAGTSRTHEMLLDFAADDPSGQSGRRELFLASPHVWLKNTQWLDDTRALGPVFVGVSPDKSGWDRVAASRHTGMWIHGNLPEWWLKDGTPGIYRMFAGGGHYGAILNDWYLYMCTGDPAHLDFAKAATGQYRDVHVVHYTTPEFVNLPADSKKVKGAVTLMATYPWFQGGSGWTIGRHMVLDYYLRGDRRSLEVAQYHVEPVIQGARGALDRGCGVQMRELMDWYEHSWDPRVAAKIDEIIGWIVESDPKAEASLKSPTPLNWTNFMPRYMDLALDPSLPLRRRSELGAFIRAYADASAGGADCSAGGMTPGPGNLLACAWRETGDNKYLMPFVRKLRNDKTPADRWLAVTGGGTAVNGNIDGLLYTYCAWRDAVQKGVIAELMKTP